MCSKNIGAVQLCGKADLRLSEATLLKSSTANRKFWQKERKSTKNY